MLVSWLLHYLYKFEHDITMHSTLPHRVYLP